MKLIVIGGGVAGSAVAYFAARRGAQVTLIDSGQGRASNVPSALTNPVRGQAGKVGPRAPEGLALTWRLVDELVKAGHEIPHGRAGVLRPVPDEATRRKWAANLPPDLPHRWLTPQEVPELAPGWHAVLEVEGGGWLDGGAFVRALQQSSGARVRRAWAARLDGNGVTLDCGEHLRADRTVWCGGSLGAARLGLSAVHRAGTLLLSARPLAARPLSFGVYAAPARAGGVLGATFEAPSPAFDDGPPPPASLDWLTLKAKRLLADFSPDITGMWTGSRLSTPFVGPRESGVWALGGLGSKGFLLGPLQARDLVEHPDFFAV